MELKVLTREQVLKEADDGDLIYDGDVLVKCDLPKGLTVNVEGNLQILGNAHVDYIRVDGNLSVTGELSSDSGIEVGGNLDAKKSVVSKDNIYVEKLLDVDGDLKSSGSINADSIQVAGNIFSHGSLTASNTIVCNKDIESNSSIKVQGPITSYDGDVVASKDIEATSIIANSIESTNGSIKVEDLIQADSVIYAVTVTKSELKSGRKLSSHISVDNSGSLEVGGSIFAFKGITAGSILADKDVIVAKGSVSVDNCITADTISTSKDHTVSAGLKCTDAHLEDCGFIKANKINSIVKHGHIIQQSVPVSM